MMPSPGTCIPDERSARMAKQTFLRKTSTFLTAGVLTLSSMAAATAAAPTSLPVPATTKSSERPKPVVVPLTDAPRSSQRSAVDLKTTNVAPGLAKSTKAHQNAAAKKPGKDKPGKGKPGTKSKPLLERPSSVGLLVNTWTVKGKSYYGLCTASVVRAKNDSVLVTAASCWLQTFHGKRHAPTSSVFYPGSGGLDTDNRPHAPRGAWEVQSAVVPQNWVRDNKSTKHDQAFLVVKRNTAGKLIGKTGPANAIAVDKKNAQRGVTVLGYPKSFDNVMTHCVGNSRGYDTLSPRLTAMRCPGMGAGAIGGPWIMSDGRLGNSGFIMGVTEYSDPNGFMVTEPFTMDMAPHYDLASKQKPQK